MNYQNISSIEPVVAHLTRAISNHLLSGETVTWLVPGGSAIEIAAAVGRHLVDENVPLENLRVTLTDERYGYVGNPDENWRQLERIGFSLPGATTYRVLQPGQDIETTTKLYAAKLKEFLTTSDYSIGLFGVGSDGHTAGIKPHMIEMDSTEYAAHFHGADFERITMTPHAIARLDKAYIYAIGSEKLPVLTDLYYEEIYANEQPAQVLKSVADLTLFTDQDVFKEEEEQL